MYINVSVGSCKCFQGQNRCFKASEEGYWKGFYSQQVISKKQLKIKIHYSKIFRKFETMNEHNKTIA